MLIRKRLFRLASDESGQAMTEAVVTLSLLGMTWVLLFYASYMGNNRIRCAVGARHAAWAAGNAVAVDQDVIRNKVFWTNQDKVTLTADTRRGSAQDNSNVQDGLDGAAGSGVTGTVIDGIVGAIRTIFPPIHTAIVKFGVDDAAGAAGTFPFVLMNTKFPFMEETSFGLFSIECYCEWDEVSNTWDSVGDIFESIIDGLF